MPKLIVTFRPGAWPSDCSGYEEFRVDRVQDARASENVFRVVMDNEDTYMWPLNVIFSVYTEADEG